MERERIRCKFYQKGQCRNGSDCPYVHEFEPHHRHDRRRNDRGGGGSSYGGFGGNSHYNSHYANNRNTGMYRSKFCVSFFFFFWVCAFLVCVLALCLFFFRCFFFSFSPCINIITEIRNSFFFFF